MISSFVLFPALIGFPKVHIVFCRSGEPFCDCFDVEKEHVFDLLAYSSSEECYEKSAVLGFFEISLSH
jgi:hypothetical protein